MLVYVVTKHNPFPFGTECPLRKICWQDPAHRGQSYNPSVSMGIADRIPGDMEWRRIHSIQDIEWRRIWFLELSTFCWTVRDFFLLYEEKWSIGPVILKFCLKIKSRKFRAKALKDYGKINLLCLWDCSKYILVNIFWEKWHIGCKIFFKSPRLWECLISF